MSLPWVVGRFTVEYCNTSDLLWIAICIIHLVKYTQSMLSIIRLHSRINIYILLQKQFENQGNLPSVREKDSSIVSCASGITNCAPVSHFLRSAVTGHITTCWWWFSPATGISEMSSGSLFSLSLCALRFWFSLRSISRLF